MKIVESINPNTGKKIASYERINLRSAREKVKKADQAFTEWKDTTVKERAKLMHRLAGVLEENLDEYARVATLEMGKVLSQSKKEIEKCAWICRYYADHSRHFLKNQMVKTEASKSYVTFQPMGVILAVMPWNFPFYQVIRFAAPTIMAGNTGVLKHASNVQGCALALENMFIEAGFPEGVFSNLNIRASQVKKIIEDRQVKGVTLTGSDPAGRSVGALAGENLKKTVMELGGSDAYIFLEDVDLDEVVETAVFGRLQNNGQTCIAAKRFVVLDAIYEDFLKKFIRKMKSSKMGNPMREGTYYGPMAREDLRDELHAQVQKSVSQGAQLKLGGKVPDRKGAFYPATVLSDVLPGNEAFDNELFGPVASVIRARDEAHAIELANNSQFGLGSGVFTRDVDRGEKVALQLEAGNSFVNKLVVSDPRLPFGGIKNSGFGRELSAFGIREFMNTKSIWIN
ncbi:UNVERIFIED_CONTAM: hypothetical protein GTU68_034031 [Idotea baltica]|nr:hypothetical protein [Idotea baltica]